VNLTFYERIVDFCLFHDIYILYGLVYGEIYLHNNSPPSILQILREWYISIKFTSLSKIFNMLGWRISFVISYKRLIAALSWVKLYLDYGAFTLIQVAAVTAMYGDQSCVYDIRALYKERQDVLINRLAISCWNFPSPVVTTFSWAPISDQYKHLGSIKFSKFLRDGAKVAVAPGISFGEHGDGHVRIGLVENVNRTRQAIQSIKVFSHTKIQIVSLEKIL